MRKRFANLFPRTVKNRAFRGPSSFYVSKTGDTDPAALDVQLFQSLHNDPPVIAPRFAHVFGPILHRGPAWRRRSRNGGNLAIKRKHRGDVRIAAPADMREIARVRLIVGGMTAVLRRHYDIEPLLTHKLAHRFPTPIPLSNGKTRIGKKFSHKRLRSFISIRLLN